MKVILRTLCAICLMSLGLLACNSIFPTSISKILQDPRGYEGREVMVSGRVVDIFSIIVMKYFIIRDDTGEIIVISEKALPRKDSQIKVYGKVEEAFSIGDQQMIVIMETSGK